jgi:hypothetical protein
VLHTAYRPQRAHQQDHGPWIACRSHGQVDVLAVVQPDGRIWTAYPDPDSPGVTQNPSTKDD